MVVTFSNPIKLDKVQNSIPIGVPVYAYNDAYSFNPGVNKVDRVMLYGLDGSITPKQNSSWVMREQAPTAGTYGWGIAYDGSNDAIIKDFKTSDQSLPSGIYGIIMTKDILSSYKTQKSFNATIVTTHTNMSTDSSGTPLSTDDYDATSKVITITVPQDPTGYTTLATYPGDPVVEWDGSFATGLSGINEKNTTGGGPDGTLPYTLSKLNTSATVDIMSQYVYMAGRTDRTQIKPATNYTITFYAKGTGTLDVYFINNFLDNTASNTATPSGVTFNVSPSPHQANSFAEISLTSTYTLYTLNIKTTANFNFNEYKQIMFRVLANSQAWITPVSMVENGTTTNVIRASTYAPTSYTNASLEFKGWQIKARTDWNGIPVQGISTMISNPVNIKSPGSKTKNFVNGLENFDLYNIVATSQTMFIKPDTDNAQMSYATNANSNISMVYGVPSNNETNGSSTLYTQHGATDSRGYSSTTIVGNDIIVYPYTKPSLANLVLVRTTNMAEIVPTFNIKGSTKINNISTDIMVIAHITIAGINYIIMNIQSNQSLKNGNWYKKESNGTLTSVSPVNISPFSSYSVTFELHDSVYVGGPKATVVTSTQVNSAGSNPVSYTPDWSSVTVGTTSASLKYTASASSNVVYNQPTLTHGTSNYATYYTGEFDTPAVTYTNDDPRYHKNLRFDFTINGTVIVGPGSIINNLSRVDFTCDGVLYSDILGGNGQNATGPYTFTTNVLNNNAGLNLDPGIVHTGSLILYDTKNGLSVGSLPSSTINWSSTPDSILFDIDGDINNGGGIGIGGYHTHSDSVLDVHGKSYVSTGIDEKGQWILKEMWDAIYPVGAIHQTTSKDFNPNKSWTGSWSLIVDRVLKGVDSSSQSGATGGNNTINLTTSQLPSHNHSFSGSAVSTSSDSHNHTIDLNDNNIRNSAVEAAGYGLTSTAGFKDRVMTLATGSYKRTATTSSDSHNHTVTAAGTIGNTGSGADINIESAYYTVYTWHRDS